MKRQIPAIAATIANRLICARPQLVYKAASQRAGKMIFKKLNMNTRGMIIQKMPHFYCFASVGVDA